MCIGVRVRCAPNACFLLKTKLRRTMIFQRTATTPLTHCLTPRVQPTGHTSPLPFSHLGTALIVDALACKAKGQKDGHDPRQDPPGQPDFHAARLPVVPPERIQETEAPKFRHHTHYKTDRADRSQWL